MSLRQSIGHDQDPPISSSVEDDSSTACFIHQDERCHWSDIAQLTVSHFWLTDDSITISFHQSEAKLKLLATGDCCSTSIFFEPNLTGLINSHVLGFSWTKISCTQEEGEVVDRYRCDLQSSVKTFTFDFIHTSNGYYSGSVEIFMC